uniref:DUF4216 domain-containing protein n=1 Tax=Chenopodium quinoa TaxID=63459 RepID=A0A803MD24_CHEQI
MYGIERNLHEMKQDVRNKARPEGSMAEGYQAKECVAFIARFLKRSSKATLEEVNECGTSKSLFPKSAVTREKAGRIYSEFPKELIKELVKEQRFKFYLNLWIRVCEFNPECSGLACLWEKVDLILKEDYDNIPDHILWLSKGPSHVAKKYTGYSVNGYSFHTMKRDANCVTQNSGVTLTTITHSFASSKDQNPVVGNVNYYGSITEIIEISYHGHFSVVLFRCQWFHSEKDDDELITVNMNKTVSKEEPFTLANQAHQVFYVEDLNREDWHMLFKSLLESFQMMKRNRPKVSVSQSQLTEYELQRPQKLKFNAERMEALGSASVAYKILEEKTKVLICPSAMQNSTPENENDDSTSGHDGENEVETDNIMEVSKQVNKSSPRPNTMVDVVEVNSRKKHVVDEVQNIYSIKVARVQDQCIQKKQQVISEKKGSKRAFCSPGSIGFGANARAIKFGAFFRGSEGQLLAAVVRHMDVRWNSELAEEKYIVPEAGREWVMQAINGSWKAHKCFIKKNYFYAYPTDALRCVTTAILTQLRDANPGINLVIPDFAIPTAPKDASSAPHLLVDQNGKSSKSGATINQ